MKPIKVVENIEDLKNNDDPSSESPDIRNVEAPQEENERTPKQSVDEVDGWHYGWGTTLERKKLTQKTINDEVDGWHYGWGTQFDEEVPEEIISWGEALTPQKKTKDTTSEDNLEMSLQEDEDSVNNSTFIEYDLDDSASTNENSVFQPDVLANYLERVPEEKQDSCTYVHEKLGKITEEQDRIGNTTQRKIRENIEIIGKNKDGDYTEEDEFKKVEIKPMHIFRLRTVDIPPLDEMEKFGMYDEDDEEETKVESSQEGELVEDDILEDSIYKEKNDGEFSESETSGNGDEENETLYEQYAPKRNVCEIMDDIMTKVEDKKRVEDRIDVIGTKTEQLDKTFDNPDHKSSVSKQPNPPEKSPLFRILQIIFGYFNCFQGNAS